MRSRSMSTSDASSTRAMGGPSASDLACGGLAGGLAAHPCFHPLRGVVERHRLSRDQESCPALVGNAVEIVIDLRALHVLSDGLEDKGMRGRASQLRSGGDASLEVVFETDGGCAHEFFSRR